MIFNLLIGLGEDMTPIDLEFTKLKVEVTWVTCKKCKNVSTHYLENYLT